MAFKPKTIRRSPAELRKHMRAYNEMAKGLRAYRVLIEAELKLNKTRKSAISKIKMETEDAESLF